MSITGCLKKLREGFARYGDSVYMVGELSLCALFMAGSGTPFQKATQVLLFALSACVMVCPQQRRDYIRSVSGGVWHKALLVFLYLWGGFALVGQRIFIFPLDVLPSLRKVAVFVLAVLWFVPVTNTGLWLLHVAGERLPGWGKRKLPLPWFCAACLMLLLIPAAVHLIAFNPGISSMDTYSCMVENAKNLRGMEDWHPAFYCMLLRAVQHVWDSTYPVIFLQWALWGYVFLDLFLYLRKKGLGDALLLGTAFVTGISPGNFIDLNTIWKDIPYALCLLWAMITAAKLTLGKDIYRGRRYVYAELAAALTGIYLLRKNGVVPFLCIALALLLALARNWKIYASLGLAAALVLTVKGPVYSALEVQDVGRRGMYIGLGQDILGVYYAGGDLSPETMEIVRALTFGEPEEFQYRPNYASSSYEVDVSPGEFIRCYLDTFFRHPLRMIQAVTAREDTLWNIFPGEGTKMGCVNYNGNMDGWEDWNQYYPAHQPNFLTKIVAPLAGWCRDIQIIAMSQWRSGLWTLLGLWVVASLLLGRREPLAFLWVIITPIAGHILGLLLSTGWSDFRYFWPLNLMNGALLLLALAAVSTAKTKTEEAPE